MKKPSIVVLDLDETLVYSTPVSSEEINEMNAKHPDAFFISCSNPVSISMVKKRKHIDHFINELKRNGKTLVVWSAGMELYVKNVCNVLFGRDTLEYILSGPHFYQFGKKKDIRVLGIHNMIPNFDINDAVLIDDRVANATDNPRNIIVVKPFQGQDDDELLRVLDLII